MAQQRDGVFTWIHADQLSSATRLTDAAGLEIRRVAYKSFDEEAENQGSGDDPKYKYTGKEQDSTGLYYYGARYYDPALARFISADTVYDAGPQGLNRYSYALNNPIFYRDPTGHFITGPDDDRNPTAYGNVTGSQGQIADGSATVHVRSPYEEVWGRGMTLDELDTGGYTSFPADPKRLASPDPILSGIGPGGYVKGKLRDLERQLYDEGGSVQQRIVDVQQGMMDELVSQGVSIIEMTDSTGGLMSGWQSRLIAGASERAMNFSYDTALGGLRPRKGGFYYKVGKYGMSIIIFLATIEADAGSVKQMTRSQQVADDLLDKGVHFNFGKIELRAVPDHLGGVTFKPVHPGMAAKNQTAYNNAVKAAKKNLQSPKFRAWLTKRAEQGVALASQAGRQKVREFKALIKALERIK